MQELSLKELRILERLRTPEKVQDFLNTLPINFEKRGETLMSPRRVLRTRTAHCFEGALLAAAVFMLQGEKPLLLDLRSSEDDEDHVVTIFRYKNHWGAVSKTNHAVLRYREPIYRTIRELALSYFHEYFLNNGKKTLRDYSQPFSLVRFNRRGWLTSEEDLWYISDALDASPHKRFLPFSSSKLRRADPIEIQAGKLVEYRP